MKPAHYKLYFCLALLLAVPWPLMAQHNRFQTDLLAKMAEALQMRTVLDTLGDGIHIAQMTYKDKPLCVIVKTRRLSILVMLYFQRR